MKNIFFMLFLFVTLSCKSDNGDIDQNPSEEKNPTWQLVFEDDFDGTSVDSSVWSMYNSPGHAGNGLRRPEAFSVKDGILTVTAQMKDGEIVSGGMAHRKNYKYGKFEFRVKSDVDPSEAMSAVVLTWPQSQNWPIDGENDIYETLNSPGDRKQFHTFIHYSANNLTAHYEHKVDATQWHTVAMEWTADKLVIYRDSVKVWTLTDQNIIPHVFHHLCIQLDAFKTEMTGTVKMYVDWVKIYQEKK